MSATTCPRRTVSDELSNAELSAPNCPATNCPRTCSSENYIIPTHIDGDLHGAEFGGRTKLTKISEWPFLGKDFHFCAQNFWWSFLVIDHDFQICQMWYMTHPEKKLYLKNSLMTPFLKIFGERMHAPPTPTSNLGRAFPQSSISLHPGWHRGRETETRSEAVKVTLESDLEFYIIYSRCLHNKYTHRHNLIII